MMPTVDLSVKLNDSLVLKNPILTASGTFGYGDEAPELVDVNRLGGIVTKSITLEPREGHVPPRISETPGGMLNAIGLANPGVDVFCHDKLPFLNSLDNAVFVSIAGSSINEYITVLEKIESQDPDIAGYEINISCPNVNEGGMEFGVSPEISESLTIELRKRTQRYLIIKLSPNVTSIADIALAAEGGGADAVSAINTVVGMMVDPLTGNFMVSNGMGGLSGPAILPIALANVYKVSRAVRIPVIGLGGLSSADDVVSMIRVGAHAVQIGTANYRDPNIGVKIIDEMAALLNKLGIKSLESIRGSVSEI